MTISDTIPIGFAITELDPGGAERAFTHLVTGLDKTRWSPTVYCLSGKGELAETIESEGIPVRYLNAGGKWDLGLIGRLSSALKQDRPQLLQTFLHHANIAGRVAAWRAGVPTVVSGIRVAEKRNLRRLRLDRWTQKLVTTNVCVSPSVAQFSQQVGGLSAEKLTVIPNGVDFKRFHDAPAIDWTTLGMPADVEVILVVGRLDDQKRPVLAFQSCLPLFENHPRLHLVYAGIGPDEKRIQELAQQHNIPHRVHCLGKRDDVPQLMRGAKLLLQTSAWEGAPNVIPEALAAGLPVIATENPGNRDALHEGTWGLLVPEKSSEITHFLTAFFESEDLSTELREWTHLAQASIQQDLTWQLTVNTYENLYQELTLSHSANT